MTPRSMMDAFEKLICCRKRLVLDEELAVARACAHSPKISKIIQFWSHKNFSMILYETMKIFTIFVSQKLLTCPC